MNDFITGIFHTRVAADVSRRHFRGRKNAPTDVGGYILLTNRAKCELSKLSSVHFMGNLRLSAGIVSNNQTLGSGCFSRPTVISLGLSRTGKPLTFKPASARRKTMRL